MTQRATTSRQVIAVSVSDSSDMPYLGLVEDHLRDAMAEIFRYSLHSGARIVYGGDLRKCGFSKLLFEIVARHYRVLEYEKGTAGVTNYFAWPVHIHMPFEEIEKTADDFAGTVDLICLDDQGSPMTLHQRRQLKTREPSAAEWSRGLTMMRRRVLKDTDARIVLGGQTEQYKGIKPGIAEETLLSLREGQPLYIVGGFGGCARDITDSMGISSSDFNNYRDWNRRREFEKFSIDDLKNGLNREDNITLATTSYVNEIIVLILRGLLKLFKAKM